MRSPFFSSVVSVALILASVATGSAPAQALQASTLRQTGLEESSEREKLLMALTVPGRAGLEEEVTVGQVDALLDEIRRASERAKKQELSKQQRQALVDLRAIPGLLEQVAGLLDTIPSGNGERDDELREKVRSFYHRGRKLLGRLKGAGLEEFPAVEVINSARLVGFRPRAFLFDFDDTLWTGYPRDFEALEWARWVTGRQDPDASLVQRIKEFLIRTAGMSWEERYVQWKKEDLPPLPADEQEFVQRFRTAMRQHMKDKRLTAPEQLTPGAKQLLQWLKSLGQGLAVITGGAAETRRQYADDLGIGEFFGVGRIYGGGRKAATIAQAAGDLGVPTADVVVIEDGEPGLRAARVNGALAVGYATSPEHRERLIAAGADVILYGDFTHLQEILQVLHVIFYEAPGDPSEPSDFSDDPAGLEEGEYRGPAGDSAIPLNLEDYRKSVAQASKLVPAKPGSHFLLTAFHAPAGNWRNWQWAGEQETYLVRMDLPRAPAILKPGSFEMPGVTAQKRVPILDTSVPLPASVRVQPDAEWQVPGDPSAPLEIPALGLKISAQPGQAGLLFEVQQEVKEQGALPALYLLFPMDSQAAWEKALSAYRGLSRYFLFEVQRLQVKGLEFAQYDRDLATPARPISLDEAIQFLRDNPQDGVVDRHFGQPNLFRVSRIGSQPIALLEADRERLEAELKKLEQAEQPSSAGLEEMPAGYRVRIGVDSFHSLTPLGLGHVSSLEAAAEHLREAHRRGELEGFDGIALPNFVRHQQPFAEWLLWWKKEGSGGLGLGAIEAAIQLIRKHLDGDKLGSFQVEQAEYTLGGRKSRMVWIYPKAAALPWNADQILLETKVKVLQEREGRVVVTTTPRAAYGRTARSAKKIDEIVTRVEVKGYSSWSEYTHPDRDWANAQKRHLTVLRYAQVAQARASSSPGQFLADTEAFFASAGLEEGEVVGRSEAWSDKIITDPALDGALVLSHPHYPGYLKVDRFDLKDSKPASIIRPVSQSKPWVIDLAPPPGAVYAPDLGSLFVTQTKQGVVRALRVDPLTDPAGESDRLLSPLVIEGLERPRALAYAREGRILYVAMGEAGRSQILAFSVRPDGSGAEPAGFSLPLSRVPKQVVYAAGKLYVSSADGIIPSDNQDQIDAYDAKTGEHLGLVDTVHGVGRYMRDVRELSLGRFNGKEVLLSLESTYDGTSWKNVVVAYDLEERKEVGHFFLRVPNIHLGQGIAYDSKSDRILLTEVHPASLVYHVVAFPAAKLAAGLEENLAEHVRTMQQMLEGQRWSDLDPMADRLLGLFSKGERDGTDELDQMVRRISSGSLSHWPSGPEEQRTLRRWEASAIAFLVLTRGLSKETAHAFVNNPLSFEGHAYHLLGQYWISAIKQGLADAAGINHPLIPGSQADSPTVPQAHWQGWMFSWSLLEWTSAPESFDTTRVNPKTLIQAGAVPVFAYLVQQYVPDQGTRVDPNRLSTGLPKILSDLKVPPEIKEAFLLRNDAAVANLQAAVFSLTAHLADQVGEARESELLARAAGLWYEGIAQKLSPPFAVWKPKFTQAGLEEQQVQPDYSGLPYSSLLEMTRELNPASFTIETPAEGLVIGIDGVDEGKDISQVLAEQLREFVGPKRLLYTYDVTLLEKPEADWPHDLPEPTGRVHFRIVVRADSVATAAPQNLQEALERLNELDAFLSPSPAVTQVSPRAILVDASDHAEVAQLAQALSIMLARDKGGLPEVDFRLVIAEGRMEQVIERLKAVNPVAAEDFLRPRVVSYRDGDDEDLERAKWDARGLLASRFGFGSGDELQRSGALRVVSQIGSDLPVELLAFFDEGGLRFVSSEAYTRLSAILEAA